MGSLKLLFLCLLPGVIYSQIVRFSLRQSKSSRLTFGRDAVASEILRSDWPLFYGDISIGTPAQNFSVTFRTQISKTWVPAANCSSYFCESRKRYLSAKSTTYEPNGESSELSSQGAHVKGVLSIDNLNIGGLEVVGQTFVEAVEVSGQIENYPQIDGVVGLGSSSSSDNSLISNMVSQGLIKKKVFSVFFNRALKTTGDVNGEIVFGGANPDHQKGNFTYVQTMTKGEWMIPVKSVDIGGKMIDRSGNTAIVDIAEGHLVGPSREVLEIFQTIGARFDVFERNYIVDCSNIDKLPTINFNIGEITLSLEAKDYIIQYKRRRPVCDTIFDISLQDTWTFGIFFINKFYTQFDLERNRIGFAEAA